MTSMEGDKNEMTMKKKSSQDHDNGDYFGPKVEQRSHTNIPQRQNISENIPHHVEYASQHSSLSRSMDFVSETRLVMLNFMGILPPSLYRDHIVSSPDFEADNLKHSHVFSKSHPLPKLTKSQSLNQGLSHNKPHSKRLGHLKSFQKDLDSPVSEDNVSYKYQKYLKEQLNVENANTYLPVETESIFASEIIGQQSAQSSSAIYEVSQSSHSLSPRKTPLSPQRQISENSSIGEYSYEGDADDEYEGSSTSSVFSSRSAHFRDGFLDLRRNVPYLPTVVDEVPGMLFRELDFREPDSLQECNSEDECGEDEADNIHSGSESDHKEEPNSRSARDLTACQAVPSKSADRSGLHLHIPMGTVQLDDVLLTFQSEINSELDEMESEFEPGIPSRCDGGGACATPRTPISQAALVLARIGDEMNDMHGPQLADMFNSLSPTDIENLSYPRFQELAQALLSHNDLNDWRQVALLMRFGQKLVWTALQTGVPHVRTIIDSCTQVVADMAAKFIIKQGGWSTIMNFDPSQSSDNQSSSDISPSTDRINSDLSQASSRGCNDLDLETDCLETKRESCGSEGQRTLIQGNSQESDEETCNVFTMSTKSSDASLTDNTIAIETGNALALGPKKPRYASSVGFEFSETSSISLDNTGEMELESDLSRRSSVIYIQSQCDDDPSKNTDDQDEADSDLICCNDLEDDDFTNSNVHTKVREAIKADIDVNIDAAENTKSFGNMSPGEGDFNTPNDNSITDCDVVETLYDNCPGLEAAGKLVSEYVFKSSNASREPVDHGLDNEEGGVVADDMGAVDEYDRSSQYVKQATPVAGTIPRGADGDETYQLVDNIVVDPLNDQRHAETTLDNYQNVNVEIGTLNTRTDEQMNIESDQNVNTEDDVNVHTGNYESSNVDQNTNNSSTSLQQHPEVNNQVEERYVSDTSRESVHTAEDRIGEDCNGVGDHSTGFGLKAMALASAVLALGIGLKFVVSNR
ncbi:uncharacterized protein LOC127852320 [Dreissena polymorpha]|uniref:Bcl-2 Bcl-2 homology region 1-3 domain-containing protein n=1 Tax=Dreissena polymorpha TaxID=45954 RepID=A0A9D4CNX0_DREPO|nr:uncharacterized protein LOC127852320 [Dreissena polymorpha]KAH3728069.1 hypothetical protein DPMN_054016 [Dreissena polymorpha]